MGDHTPTPWNAQYFRAIPRAEVSDLDEPTVGYVGDYRITVAGCRGYDLHESDDLDAAFIVRACNSHDALLAKLQHIYETARSRDWAEHFTAEDAFDALGLIASDAAAAALRLAKGDQSNG